MKLTECVVLLALAGPAVATDFQLAGVMLPGGVTIFGTVSTDGSVGPLTAANITGWKVTVRTTTHYGYSPGQPGGASLMGVSVTPDGQHLRVKTSPDGLRDGGLLAFGSFGPGPEHGVQVANFTGPHAAGGTAFYLSGPAFEWHDYAAPNHSQWTVAKAAAGSSVHYKLVPVIFPSGAAMGGQITTDGSTGPLDAFQLLDWQIMVRAVDDRVYFKTASSANSVLLPATAGLSTDGLTLFVDGANGYLGVGVPAVTPRRPEGAVPADFGDLAPRKGQAGYFNAFAVQYVPLRFSGTAYPVARVAPQAAPASAMLQRERAVASALN
ncbi:MAG TPA: hypothetical protein VFY73_14045 [Ideonella sp.]|uniref:hypothetical protein n=1 Tax=Ideonella sp. TaxID=1929293 RepID=UPI002E329F23|nr:hypothetical protein [Ideonella sp.]HEX5685139.1 hypothetical protein [Ideonella sp.]